jgi:hypothetical protein
MDADIVRAISELTAALEDRYEHEAQELAQLRIALAAAREAPAVNAGAEKELEDVHQKLNVARVTIQEQQMAISAVRAVGARLASRAVLRALNVHQETALGRCFLRWQQFGAAADMQATVAALEAKASVSDVQRQQLAEERRLLLADLRHEQTEGEAKRAFFANEVARLEGEARRAEAARHAAEEKAAAEKAAAEKASAEAMVAEMRAAAAEKAAVQRATESAEIAAAAPAAEAAAAVRASEVRAAAQAWSRARDELRRLAAPALQPAPPSLRVLTQEGLTIAHWSHAAVDATSRASSVSWQQDGRLAGRLGITQGRAQARAGIVPRAMTSPAIASASVLLCAGLVGSR